MKKITTKSDKETFDFAKNFAKSLRGGETITLQGALGAGKTVFTKGLAKGLGVKRVVTSPTFVVMKNYRVPVKSLRSHGAGKNHLSNKHEQELRINELIHIDAYRLSSGEDLKAIGVEEYFTRDDCVVVIEWPEKVESVLPECIKIKIKIKDDLRVITLI